MLELATVWFSYVL